MQGTIILPSLGPTCLLVPCFRYRPGAKDERPVATVLFNVSGQAAFRPCHSETARASRNSLEVNRRFPQDINYLARMRQPLVMYGWVLLLALDGGWLILAQHAYTAH